MKLHLARIGDDLPSLEYGGYASYGIIGTDTNTIDCNGDPIYVGCMVKVTKECGGGGQILFVVLIMTLLKVTLVL